MSSYDTGEAKEDDAAAAAQCDVEDVPEIPTEDGKETTGCGRAVSSQVQPVVVAQFQEMSSSGGGGGGTEALQRLLHNDSSAEPKLSLKKQDSSTSIRSEGRKVSFPRDADLVTGYLEPVNPWAEGDFLI